MESARTGVVLGLVICTVLNAASEEILVDGDDFVSYKIGAISLLPSWTKHTLGFDFKTVEPNGMLVYVGDEQEKNDLLMIDLVYGKLRITVNLGDNIATPRGHLVLGNHNWADNRWHTVWLTLIGNQLNVSVNDQLLQTALKSKFTRLDVNGFVYAGGAPQQTLDTLHAYRPASNLKGCLRDIFFDKIPVLVGPTKANLNYRVHGSPKNVCRPFRFITLRFQYPEAYLYMPSKGKDYFSVQMRFRTYFANGVLASKGILNACYVSVSLVKGKVVLKFQASIGSQVIQLSHGKNLNDGEWHQLSVVVSKQEMKLKLDQLPELKHENPSLQQVEHFSENIYIGHYPNSSNFIGCINELHVDDKVIQLNKIPRTFMFGNLSHRCDISSHCFPNPCLHRGKCNEARSGSFLCNCQRTFHRGPLCERPIFLRTCWEYKIVGQVVDAHCKVDPDGDGPTGPLLVLCNMTEQNQAVTLINHSKVWPQLVSSDADYMNSEIYIHRVKYRASLEGIKALIAQSKRCRQFVSFRCFGSKLLQSPAGPAQVRWQGGGSPRLVTDHWPGAPAGSGKCACGMNGTCEDPELSCNCDIGDETWREDKGYVTDISNLPVTLLEFHGSASRSNFTVGPLECFGAPRNTIEVTREVQREASQFLYSLCHVNPTTPELHSSASTLYHTEQRAGLTTENDAEEVSTVVSTSQSASTVTSFKQDAVSWVRDMTAWILVGIMFFFLAITLGYFLSPCYLSQEE